MWRRRDMKQSSLSPTTPQPPLPLRLPSPHTAASPSPAPASTIPAFAAAFWKFLRPHTIRGTILGSVALTVRSLLEAGTPLASLDWSGLLPRAALGVLALLAGNGYIVGINQIYDVDIDVVNKPFLPVAAGDLTPGAAWVLVAALASAGLALTAACFGTAITRLYAFGLFLGTIYSVPPLRLKRFPVPAFAIIATVRGFLLNVGVYAAARAALGLPFVWSPATLFITCFVTLFAVAIAVTKDLPDVDGDRAHGVSTFVTRAGVPAVATLGTALLGLNYVGAITLAVMRPASFFRPQLAIGAHALLAAALIALRSKLARDNHTLPAISAFYRGVWNLFYAEYLLFPFL